MTFPFYQAMTPAEFSAAPPRPEPVAWMACHFSRNHQGLSGCPASLPPDSMLILDDSIPASDHSPEQVARELTDCAVRLRCRCVLLDFQRPRTPRSDSIVSRILNMLPCAAAVPPPYAEARQCPVFLPPVPLNMLPGDYFSPWKGREIWLEAALDTLGQEVTAGGSRVIPAPALSSEPRADQKLLCHYRMKVEPDLVRFSLFRTREDLGRLLEQSARCGVTAAVGLYQELGK